MQEKNGTCVRIAVLQYVGWDLMALLDVNHSALAGQVARRLSRLERDQSTSRAELE